MLHRDTTPLVCRCIVDFHLAANRVSSSADDGRRPSASPSVSDRNDGQSGHRVRDMADASTAANKVPLQFLSPTEADAILDSNTGASLFLEPISSDKTDARHRGSPLYEDFICVSRAHAYELPLEDIVAIHTNGVPGSLPLDDAVNEIRLDCAHTTECGVVHQVRLRLSVSAPPTDHNAARDGKELHTDRDAFVRELTARHAHVCALRGLTRFITQSRCASREVHAAQTDRTATHDVCKGPRDKTNVAAAVPVAMSKKASRERVCDSECNEPVDTASDTCSSHLSHDTAACDSDGAPRWFPAPPRGFVLVHNDGNDRNDDKMEERVRQRDGARASHSAAASSYAGASSEDDAAEVRHSKHVRGGTNGLRLSRRTRGRARQATTTTTTTRFRHRRALLQAAEESAVNAVRAAWAQERERTWQRRVQQLACFPALTDAQRLLIDFDALLEPMPSCTESTTSEENEEKEEGQSDTPALCASTSTNEAEAEAMGRFVGARDASTNQPRHPSDKDEYDASDEHSDTAACVVRRKQASVAASAPRLCDASERAVRLAVLSLINKSCARHAAVAADSAHAGKKDVYDTWPGQASTAYRCLPDATDEPSWADGTASQRCVGAAGASVFAVSATIQDMGRHSNSSLSNSRSSESIHAQSHPLYAVAAAVEGQQQRECDVHTRMTSLVTPPWQPPPPSCNEQEHVGEVCHRPCIVPEPSSSTSSCCSCSGTFYHKDVVLQAAAAAAHHHPDPSSDFAYPLYGSTAHSVPSNLCRRHSHLLAVTPSTLRSGATGHADAELFLSRCHSGHEALSYQPRQQQEWVYKDTSGLDYPHESAEM